MSSDNVVPFPTGGRAGEGAPPPLTTDGRQAQRGHTWRDFVMCMP